MGLMSNSAVNARANDDRLIPASDASEATVCGAAAWSRTADMARGEARVAQGRQGTGVGRVLLQVAAQQHDEAAFHERAGECARA